MSIEKIMQGAVIYVNAGTGLISLEIGATMVYVVVSGNVIYDGPATRGLIRVDSPSMGVKLIHELVEANQA